eukprot:571210-Pelagomonas_calceolata.AAC.6
MPLLERGWDAFSRVVQKHTSGLLGEYVSWQAAKGPSFNTRGYVCLLQDMRHMLQARERAAVVGHAPSCTGAARASHS